MQGCIEVMTGLASDFRVGECLRVQTESPEPPATIPLSHTTETNPCHHSLSGPRNPRSRPRRPRAHSSLSANLGMDVHKDSITIAVLPGTAKTPTQLERRPTDLVQLKKWFDRVAKPGELRACDEASGAG